MAREQGQGQGQGQGNRFLQLLRRARAATAAPAVTGGGVVIAFPDSARLRLERLARELRQSFERGGFARGGGDSLFALDVTAGPRPRLLIDQAAFVACNAEAQAWQVVVDHGSDTRVTLDSSDFGSVERFVRLYIVGRISELTEGAFLS
jgi:hypothetical protein